MPHPQGKKAKLAKQRRASLRRSSSADDREARAERQSATARHRQQIRQKRRRSARIKGLATTAVVALIVASVGYVVWTEVRPGPELAGVERPAYQGRGHITGASYASSTPTSGAHDSRAPSCRVYPTPLEPSAAVHALEHGTVVLWFDASRPELGADLGTIAGGWDSHVIVSPAIGLNDPIVATAWHRLKSYDSVVPEIDEFIRTYRRRGPEDVSCDLT